MSKIIFGVLLIFIAPTLAVNLSGRIKLLNGNEYYTKVLQETFYEIEQRGFCNLTLRDFSQNLNVTLYNWHVLGHVNYTKGFVVSIERIALTSLSSSATHTSAGLSLASFSANINMFGVRVGYDVRAVLENEGTHVFTGVFTHSSIQQTIFLQTNLDTKEMTATPTTNSVAGGSGVRMVYMPESTVSEALSRHFQASSTHDNLKIWSENIIIPIMFDKAKQVKFPDYCVNC